MKEKNNIDTKKSKKTNKKKNVIVFIIILFIIISSVGGLAIYKNINNERLVQEQKELDEKLEKCYVAINDNYNFEEFKEIVSTIQDKDDKSKAYNKLSEALDNLIENLYANFSSENDMKLYEFFRTMKDDETVDSELKQIIDTKNKYKFCEGDIYSAQRYENEGDLAMACIMYGNAIKEIEGIDTDKMNSIVEKRNEIKNEGWEKLKNELRQKLSEKDYNGNYKKYENFIAESNDNELKEMYEQFWNEQVDKSEAEERERKKNEGVYIGMTQQQVRDSMWGEPLKINRTTTKYGIHEQWVYPNNNYLYFDNGKLTAIQN